MSPCQTEPIPASSKTTPLLAKAELVGDVDSTSMIAYLRKGKKMLYNSNRDRGERICERNSPADI